jgi:hypothetical protein
MTQQATFPTTGDPGIDAVADEIEIIDTTTEVDAVASEGPDEVEIAEDVQPDEPAAGHIYGTPPATTQPQAPAQMDSAQMGRLQALEEQNRMYQEQQQRAVLDQEESRAVEQLENQGYTYEQAQAVARQARQAYEQNENQRAQNERGIANERARFQVAMIIGKQYEVNPSDLIGLDSPQSMEHEAQRQKQVNDLQSQVAGLKKKSVPPGQVFDNGRSASIGRDDAGYWVDQYNAGSEHPKARAAARRAAGFG